MTNRFAPIPPPAYFARELMHNATPHPEVPLATAGARPPRRPRYRGSHPRRFDEKYKEHQPERYAVDVEKILAAGKTPAGTHRPICVREILEVLAPRPGDLAVDATLGYGGHARELLQAITPDGRLLALDVDPIELPKTEARLRAAGYGPDSLRVQRTNFAGLPQALAAVGWPGADVVLADLGLSSMQIDNPARGFTFKAPGPLDLRMNPGRGQPAAEWLASLEAETVATLLVENADEPRATPLAQALVSAGREHPIRTTTGLAGEVRDALARLGVRERDEVETTIRRVFQALRIAVNDEFGALEAFLRHLPGCLKPGGRAAILTFHSGEDRRVKKSFLEGARSGAYQRVADQAVRPSAEEVRSNPRAASAKLRWAIRAGGSPV